MHIQLVYQNITQQQKDILIARLADYCAGFEEGDSSLKAIIDKNSFQGDLRNILNNDDLKPSVEEIPEQNWNVLWESSFEPVVVDDFVAVRAGFHKLVKNVEHEIVITPKMSFGTGHHATTYLMIQMMRRIDFENKSVFDFGTGTGILAILAKKLGAKAVIASDIDAWSIENAAENFNRNDIDDINLVQSDVTECAKDIEVVLANINKNVLLKTVPFLKHSIKNNGILLLSGLLLEDEAEITEICKKNNLLFIEKSTRNGWIALKYSKL